MVQDRGHGRAANPKHEQNFRIHTKVELMNHRSRAEKQTQSYVHVSACAESSRFHPGRRPMQRCRPVAPRVSRPQPPLPLNQRHARIHGTPTSSPEQRRAIPSVGLPAVPPKLALTSRECYEPESVLRPREQSGHMYVVAAAAEPT